VGKIILHVIRYMEPEEWEFEADDIRGAVGFAIEGMYECHFAIDRITDDSGKTLLTDDEILAYDR
jgi:hypothetical protein